MNSVHAPPTERPFCGYYHGLDGFEDLFASGNAILTYHKLGPRPRGVRLKGLYLSAPLFTAQLTELREAGFQAGTPGPALSESEQMRARRVGITFDDGYRNALRHGLPALQRTGSHAIEFLVANFLGKTNEWDAATGECSEPLMDVDEIREWLAAGNEIGAHTCTHPFLTRIPLSRAREEIIAGKKKLEDLFGHAIVHFCYPYGDWNEGVRDLVEEAGYATACTTTPGINLPGDSPFTLKRFTARYRSRSLRNLWAAVRRMVGA